MWKPLTDQGNELLHSCDRLSRLGRNADTRMLGQREHIALLQHDVESIQISGQPPDLYVIAPPDDHDVISVARETCDGPMRDMHERTGRLHDPQAGGPRGGQRPL